MTSNQIRIAEIHKAYNADHDVGPNAPVPWYVMILLSAIEELHETVTRHELEIAMLRKTIEDTKPDSAR